MAKQILLIDTETNKENEVFDIGFIIGDKKGNISEKGQYILFDEFQKKIFYEKKRNLYINYINDGIAKVDMVSTVFQRLTNLIRHYNVKEVWAYNGTFDYTKFEDLSIKHSTQNPIGHLKHQCVWSKVVQTIGTSKKFQKWAEENNLLSAKGITPTNAEIMYAFLTDNPHYQEEHTSLADCEIEYELLVNAFKKRTPCFDGISNNIWLLAQTEEQIANIPEQFKRLIVPAGQEDKAQKMLNYHKKDLKITVK